MTASSESNDADTTSSECREVDVRFDMAASRQGCFGRRFALRKVEGEWMGNPPVVAKKKRSDSKDMREKYLTRQPRELEEGKRDRLFRLGKWWGIAFQATRRSAGLQMLR